VRRDTVAPGRERTVPDAQQDAPSPWETAAAWPSGGRPERARRSPSGDWPEAPAESVPGPRRGDEAAPGKAATTSDLPRRSARKPAARSAGDAGGETWSFFSRVPKEPADGAGPGPDAAPRADALYAESRKRLAAEPSEPAAADGPAAGKRAAAEPAAAEPAAADRDEPAAAAPGEQAVAPEAAALGPEAEDEPSAESAPGATTDPSATAGSRPARDRNVQVSVVPGITRYHRGQCILIRFLSQEDLQTMTLQAAEMASYIPCKACLPEQILPGD
jgi:hypothetical protein